MTSIKYFTLFEITITFFKAMSRNINNYCEPESNDRQFTWFIISILQIFDSF